MPQLDGYTQGHIGVWTPATISTSSSGEPWPPEPEPDPEPTPEDERVAMVTPRSYRHVTRLVTERPWAVQARLLSLMVELVRFRSQGGLLSAEQIEERLAAARAEQGDRAGGVLVGSVAVIPMYGLITQRASLMSDFSGGTSVDQLREALRTALADPAVAAVVFDVDSPGGSVDGLTEFASELRQARASTKPIVAQVNTLAASAAYWLASQTSEVVMTPSGEVGSIGVFAAHEDESQAQAMAGIKTTLISAGPYKTEGNPYEPLTDEAQAAIQDQVDAYYAMFVKDVALGRGVTAAAVTSGYGQGRTLLAEPALAAGMVDRIGTLEATVRRLQGKPAGRRGAASAALIELEPAAVVVELSEPPAAIAAGPISLPDRAWNKRMAQRRRRR